MKLSQLSIIGIAMLLFASSLSAREVSRLEVEQKAEELQVLIERVRQKKHDVVREEMTLHTALLFLDYADYDESHSSATLEACKLSAVYGEQAEEMAALLPNFQREESLVMLEEAIQTLEDIESGAIPYRKAVPIVDWVNARLEGASVVNPDGHPVFLADYSFKDTHERLAKYYGNLGGFHYDFNFTLENRQLGNNKGVELRDNLLPTIGSPFLGHGLSANSWITRAYPGIDKGARTFTKYDIDHPEVRILWDTIIAQIAPYLKDKPASRLGYLLANEPHWHTAAHTWDTPIEDLNKAGAAWDTGDLSDYSIDKFRVWLENEHDDIDNLNRYWKTNYADFDDVEIELPLDNELLGKAIWYDWMKFNQYRCTEWFKFLIETVRKHDPKAFCHVKVMPNLWTENKGDHGLDFEAITELSGVIGNDAAAGKERAWGGAQGWEQEYDFNWHEMCMGFDFFRSVSPNKANFNSEVHYMMHTGYMDLYMQPEYPRCVYWLSAMMGCDINQSWVWSRKDNEETKEYAVNMSQAGSSHVGSVTTQPRILNEITKVHMDLSAHGYDVRALSTLRQPIRIYYTETSALNKRTHMDDIFELYEALFFKGIPIGFATERIIKNQDNSQWDMILVKNSDNVTEDELRTLQGYLDNGGTIIMDRNSCTRNQYMIKHSPSLKLNTTKGGRIVQASEVNDFVTAALSNLKETSQPIVNVTETNSQNRNVCVWRSVEYPANSGRYVLTLTNIGKADTKIKITLPGESKVVACRDLFTYKSISGEMTVKPEQVVFVEMGNLSPLSIDKPTVDHVTSVFPSLFEDVINVSGAREAVKIYNLSGKIIYSNTATETMKINTQHFTLGMYLVNIDGRFNHKIVKL